MKEKETEIKELDVRASLGSQQEGKLRDVAGWGEL